MTNSTHTLAIRTHTLHYADDIPGASNCSHTHTRTHVYIYSTDARALTRTDTEHADGTGGSAVHSVTLTRTGRSESIEGVEATVMYEFLSNQSEIKKFKNRDQSVCC